MTAVALAVLPFQVLAEAGNPYVEPEKRLARARRVVPPDYPKQALESQLQGYVDVTGVVSGRFSLEQVTYEPDSEASTVFVPALEKVLQFWRFESAIGMDCKPSNVPVTLRVHFEIDGTQGRVFLTQQKGSQGGNWSRQPKFGDEYKPTRTVTPWYPTEMRRDGIDAYVYSKLTIAPSGEVIHVESTGYILPPDIDRTEPVTPRQQRVLDQIAKAEPEAFEASAIRALQNWRYAPLTRDELRYTCHDFLFRIAW